MGALHVITLAPTASSAALGQEPAGETLNLDRLRGLRTAPTLNLEQRQQLQQELAQALGCCQWFTVGVMAPGEAEALAALIQTSLRPQDGPLLLASGARQGRELAAQLRISGFRLMRRIAYAARPQKTLPAAARLALLQGQVCAVLVFSAETGQAFGRAFAQAKELSPALLAGVEALVISHTARFPLFHLPWRQIRVASFPNQDQLVGLLP
jgi:uroporphyrinogen-III synthase